MSSKGRIAPGLVTPAAGESILKLHIGRDALSLVGVWTGLQPRAAAAFAAYTVDAFQWRGTTPKVVLPWRSGPQHNAWFPGPARVHNTNGISIGSSVFVELTVVSNRRTDRQTQRLCATSVARNRIFEQHTMRPNNKHRLSATNCHCKIAL